MNIKDRLKNVFKETFLDLFHDEAPSKDTIDSALAQARSGVEEATDALAAFTVAHLHLTEEHQHAAGQIEAVGQQLETALAANDDDLARALIRKRQPLQKEAAVLGERVETSNKRLLELKGRVAAMKAQVLEIERKKLELQLRDRAADAIDQVNLSETTIGQARDFATSADAEEATLQKEAGNEIAEAERDSVDSRLDKLIEEDEIEQELSRLKQQRN
ncbi:hypothetical protein PDESU_00169 [Pontiella desulfatans]|uniref:Phage shock protein A n=1 Tax=Pontiella desulfatans TaxID=2750659 RepID=A0A6C2TVU6_PONDE|nr:PspA/IM30 family protein [Pontiella desulfatans]VGO11624.1 hypothetical protein PDESU_00169 [Pontiella desulfatans]